MKKILLLTIIVFTVMVSSCTKSAIDKPENNTNKPVDTVAPPVENRNPDDWYYKVKRVDNDAVYVISLAEGRYNSKHYYKLGDTVNFNTIDLKIRKADQWTKQGVVIELISHKGQ